MEIVDRLEAARAALGETFDEAAATLYATGCFGVRVRTTCCPLVKHFRKYFEELVRIDDRIILETPTGSIFFAFNDVEAKIVREFDAGQMPYLEASLRGMAHRRRYRKQLENRFVRDHRMREAAWEQVTALGPWMPDINNVTTETTPDDWVNLRPLRRV
ncbi:MAG TPA: hypothetical protein VLF21_02385 [Candidatus Saccharimonadales bacterium]|nr:hypothetical protein [Candidatus Saccharimonadales bacterium]